ncbi:MAG: HDIG domain-containing protein [Candidatus Melainabacteria bacterium]|nr:HDIG domain-containing protein [Candidatus Melainabacteria bacterium]
MPNTHLKTKNKRPSVAPVENTAELDTSEQDWAGILLRVRGWLAFLSTSVGRTCLLGGLLVAILTLVLSADYLAMLRVAQDGISTQTIYAPYGIDVMDEAATQDLVDQARNSVAPIYQSESPINDRMHENLTTRLIRLKTLSRRDVSNPAELNEMRSRFYDVVGQSSESDLLFLHLFNAERPGQQAGRDAVTSSAKAAQAVPGKNSNAHRTASPGLSEGFWERVALSANLTLDRILKKGVSVERFFDSRDAIIWESIPTVGVTQDQRQLVRLLVGEVLQPNRVLDDEALNRARRLAADKVRPVVKTYRKGERIVSRGELLLPVQVKALQQMGKTVQGINGPAFLGVLLLSCLFSLLLWMALFQENQRRFFSPAYAGLLVVLTSLTLIAFRLLYYVYDTFSWLSTPVLSLYAFPLAAYTLILFVFTNARLAILATTALVFLLALTLKVDINPLTAMLLGSVAGVFVLSRQKMTDRAQLSMAVVYVSATQLLVSYALYGLNLPATLQSTLVVTHLLTLGACTIFGGIVSGILTTGLLPFLESSFSLITPYTLLELGNHDKPLLKRMQFEAPGTFHHSLMVASMAEAAAEAVGADPLLCRVGSLYHDIGKMKRPLFFVENQAYFGVENPHDKLTPRLSKMVIAAHTRDGVEMARENRLPSILQKFMTEHHGTNLVGHFYFKACESEGSEHVSKSQFRYPGPKPTSRETAICMLADGCESATRALKNPTLSQLEERVDKIFRQCIDDGQFDNCPITFHDIHVCRETFIRVLRGIRHNRLEYQEHMIRELGQKFPASPPAPTLNGSTLNGQSQEALTGGQRAKNGPLKKNSEPAALTTTNLAVSRVQPVAPPDFQQSHPLQQAGLSDDQRLLEDLADLARHDRDSHRNEPRTTDHGATGHGATGLGATGLGAASLNESQAIPTEAQHAEHQAELKCEPYSELKTEPEAPSIAQDDVDLTR